MMLYESLCLSSPWHRDGNSGLSFLQGRGGGRGGPIAPDRAAEHGTSARPGRRVQLQTLEQYQKTIAAYENSYSEDVKARSPRPGQIFFGNNMLSSYPRNYEIEMLSFVTSMTEFQVLQSRGVDCPDPATPLGSLIWGGVFPGPALCSPWYSYPCAHLGIATGASCRTFFLACF